MTVTVRDLAIELRLSIDGTVDAAQEAVLDRVRGTATRLIERYASDAPDPVKDEAAVRCASFLYDVPPGSSATTPQNAFVSSGAQALLAPWRVQRAWIVGGDEPEDLDDE